MKISEYKSTIPEGVSGNWKVEKFIVSEFDEKLEIMRSMFSFSSRGRYTPQGDYTRLMRNGTCVMSDTPDELRDQRFAILEAKNHVLINGLGLGCIAELCLMKPEVSFVTVIEISEDVINLVGNYLKAKYPDKLNIVLADAMEFKPLKGAKFGMVWHDIWDNICSDNLPEMKKLHRKYGRYTEWQGSWCRERCIP
uniref:Methyltransferase n=1 Tax=viral metagenome TaxID=1070528 RepID=A0A6M3L984_9ZZZZ